MSYLNNPLFVVLIGIVLVTIIDTAGSIISRKLNINYSYFSVASIFVYVYAGYLVMNATNYMTISLISVIAICLYDANVGWKISLKLAANYGKNKDLTEKLTANQRVLVGILFGIIWGLAGILIAGL